jgi:predicted dehydrogenase
MRALIVGGGWMGRLHAECLSEMAGIEVAGLVEPSAESASGFTATFDVPVFSSLRPAVTDLGRVDIACIAAPTGLHAPLAIEALAAGLHVVIEKPVATTVSDAERMIAAARAADRTLSVILQYRFNRDALRLKRAVDADALGDIVFANVVNYISRDVSYFAANGGWRGTWELNGGGILINQSTHGMDLLDWCMGPIVEARAFAGTRFHGVEVEDNLSAAVRFATGATGIVQVTSGADQNYPLKLEIVGRRGMAVFERARLTALTVPGSGNDLLTDADLAQLPPAPAEAFGEPFGTAHRRQFRAIVDALRHGRQPPVSGADAVGSLRTINTIYAAAGLLPDPGGPVGSRATLTG